MDYETYLMQTPEDVARLHAAFIDSGGTGSAPEDQLMYEPVRSCSLRDPFGTNILIFCPLSSAADTAPDARAASSS